MDFFTKSEQTILLNAENIIVEFFDYNCGYCKRAHKEIMDLLDQKRDIKVIYKNLPILSKQSTYLAKLSLALGKKNNSLFLEFHDYIFNLKKIGLSREKLVTAKKKLLVLIIIEEFLL